MPIYNFFLNGLLPTSVVVTFPKYVLSTVTPDKNVYLNAQRGNIPFPSNVGDLWAETISIADFPTYGANGIGGYTQSVVFHDTARAYLNSAAGSDPPIATGTTPI